MADNYASEQKRAELRDKVDAAQKRNAERSLGEYASKAREDATSFVKEHPFTTVLGGLAVGVLIASVVPGPGRKLRKKAAKRGSALAAAIAEAGMAYGAQLLESAGKSAQAGEEYLEDAGSSLKDSARSLVRGVAGLAGDASDGARSLSRDAGEKASRTFRDLRSRMAH